MDQNTRVAGLADVLCPGGMELAGSEDPFFPWEAVAITIRC